MSKKNGGHIADRVKAALAPKPPRITLIALTVVYDAQKGTAGVTFTSPQSGALDIADLYQAVEAARRHVMQMEQQMLLQQAAAQPSSFDSLRGSGGSGGAEGKLAEAVVLPADRQNPVE